MKRGLVLAFAFCLLILLSFAEVSAVIWCNDLDKNSTYPDGLNIYQASYISFKNSFSSPITKLNDSCFDQNTVNETYCCSGPRCLSAGPSSRLVDCPNGYACGSPGKCVLFGEGIPGVELTYPTIDPLFVDGTEFFYAFGCKNLSAMSGNRIYFYADFFGSGQRVLSTNRSCTFIPDGTPVPPGVIPCPQPISGGTYAFILSKSDVFGSHPWVNLSNLENGNYRWNCQYNYSNEWGQVFSASAPQDKNIQILIGSGNSVDSSGYVDSPILLTQGSSKELLGGTIFCNGPVLRNYFKFYNSTMGLILPPNPSESAGVVYSVYDSPNLSITDFHKGACTVTNGSRYGFLITPNGNFYGQSYIRFKATLGNYSGVSNKLIVNVQPLSDSPYLIDGEWNSVSWENGSSTSVDLNTKFADPNGDVLIYSISPTAFNGMNVTLSGSIIEFSSIGGFVGINYMNVTAKDPALHSVTVSNILLQSLAPDSLPVITSHDPNSSVVSLNKNQAKTFSITKFDPNGNPLGVKWYLDSKFVANQTDSYTFSGNISKYYVLKVKVYNLDETDLESSFTWDIAVGDVDRGDGFDNERCIPDCANTLNVCAGQTFSDGCNGYCEGQKDCSGVGVNGSDSEGGLGAGDQSKSAVGKYALYALIIILGILIVGILAYLLVVLKKNKKLIR